MELCGFWDNVCITLNKIDDKTDVLKKFRNVFKNNGDMITIGIDGCNCSICVKIDSGCVILDDWECEEKSILAGSLSEFFFSKLKPREDSGELFAHTL